MIHGLGVLGWGVGGIEAEAAMLGQPVSMLIPEFVVFKLHGKLPPGARTVFVLHDIEGYRHEEISRMTGSAEGTLRAQLHRARKLLMEALSR